MRRKIEKIKVNCKQCGKEMLHYPKTLECGKGKFCSNSCSIKYRNVHSGNPASKPEVRAKISKNHADVSGKNNPAYKGKKQIVCKTCGKIFFDKFSSIKKYCCIECCYNDKEWKQSISKTLVENQIIGLQSHTKGFKGGKRADLNDQYFRSSWEANFARILKYENKQYEFETKSFEIKMLNGDIKYYLPDFKVNDEYFEIKGYYYVDGMEKFKLFKQQHPNLKITLIDSKEYLKLEKKYKNKIKEWE